jgi:hypothetical protein
MPSILSLNAVSLAKDSEQVSHGRESKNHGSRLTILTRSRLRATWVHEADGSGETFLKFSQESTR